MDLTLPHARFSSSAARQWDEEQRRFDQYQDARQSGQQYVTDYRRSSVSQDYNTVDGANVVRNTRGVPFTAIPVPF